MPPWRAVEYGGMHDSHACHNRSPSAYVSDECDGPSAASDAATQKHIHSVGGRRRCNGAAGLMCVCERYP